jgi:hypothetical protein
VDDRLLPSSLWLRLWSRVPPPNGGLVLTQRRER